MLEFYPTAIPPEQGTDEETHITQHRAARLISLF
jgi:hypothetical protein